MGRLIGFILVCSIFLVFIVFNLGNKSDISLGIREYKDIPIFLTAFSSFVVGMLFTIPFVLSFTWGRKKQTREKPADSPSSPRGIRKLWGKKAKNNQQELVPVKDDVSSGLNEIKREDSSYGID